MRILIAVLFCALHYPVYAAFPVVPVSAEEQLAMVNSGPPELAANKKVAWNLYRVVMSGQLDLLDKFSSKESMTNHNPNEESGFEGMKAFLRGMVGEEERPLPEVLPNLVTIFAEGDMVILAFAREFDHPTKPGEKYTSTWFDMFRVRDGLVVEHWDAATIGPDH